MRSSHVKTLLRNKNRSQQKHKEEISIQVRFFLCVVITEGKRSSIETNYQYINLNHSSRYVLEVLFFVNHLDRRNRDALDGPCRHWDFRAFCIILRFFEFESCRTLRVDCHVRRFCRKKLVAKPISTWPTIRRGCIFTYKGIRRFPHSSSLNYISSTVHATTALRTTSTHILAFCWQFLLVLS